MWAAEIAVSSFNYFVLVKRVYEPRVGSLRAHQIGMTTRIGYTLGAASRGPSAPTLTGSRNGRECCRDAPVGVRDSADVAAIGRSRRGADVAR